MESIQFKTINYKAGAYVYVEEQGESGAFYIVRSGKLIEENPINELTGEDDVVLGPGDFFGVLECMSHRAHISSLQVLEDALLIIVRHEQFEMLIKQMSPIALKIIRHFSNRLRKYNDAMGRLAFNDPPSKNKDTGLFSVARYYKGSGQKLLAGYAYSQYLKLPGELVKEAQEAQEAIAVLGYNPASVLAKRTGIQEVYGAGVPIFVEHEEGSTLYIVLEGHIKITKVVDGNEILLGIMKSKDIFGEMAILENSPRSATAVAMDEATVLAINKSNFEEYIKKHPEIARRIIELLSDRIWLINRRLSNQLITDTATKIYGALLTLLQKNRIPLQKGLAYTFEMGVEDLAGFIGLEPNEGVKSIRHLISSDPTLEIKEGKIASRDSYAIRSAMALSGRSHMPKQRKK